MMTTIITATASTKYWQAYLGGHVEVAEETHIPCHSRSSGLRAYAEFTNK